MSYQTENRIRCCSKVNRCRYRTCYFGDIADKYRGKVRRLATEYIVYLSLPILFDAMDSAVLLMLRDYRCSMASLVKMQPMGSGGWIILRRAAAKQVNGYSS